MATLIQVRRDTLTNWNTNNPVLANGEIAFVTDENKFKVGNGSSNFSSLPYLQADAYIDSVILGTDTTGDYVAQVTASGSGISVTGSGESASVTISNTGVVSLAGTANEIEVSASSGNITLSLPATINADTTGNAATVTNGALTTGKLSQFAATTSSELAEVISDETGTGSLVFSSDPSLTGTPIAPTAEADTNTTQIATTAFVLAQASSSNPVMDGTVAIGTSTRYARADHVHPTDTSRAPLASPTFTGTVTAPTVLITTADTTTAASHYVVETASDGILRPKTLANVQAEIVTNTQIQSVTVSPTAAGSTGIRRTTMSTSAPTGGNDGDVWLLYT